jgi:P-type conjugative transfer protein TrbJ
MPNAEPAPCPRVPRRTPACRRSLACRRSAARRRPPASHHAAAHRRAPATLVLALAALLLVLAAPPAGAQIPVTDTAHIALNAAWHYVHYLQFAFQIYQHYSQIANQLRQIENQLLALKKLSNPSWRDLQYLLSDLDFLVRSGMSIGYALPDAGGQLASTFPGWTPWQDPGLAQRQSARALDTLRAGLAAISRQAQTFTPGEAQLAGIRQQMTGTRGHQEALEQLATLQSFAAQEQLLSRQSLAVGANLQAVSAAYWIDREAQGRAAVEVVLAETALAGHQSTSPGWTFQPPPQLLP